MKITKKFFKSICLFHLLMGALYGSEIVVNTEEGEAFVMEVDSEASLAEIYGKVAALSGESSNFIIEVSSKGEVKNFGLHMSRSQGGYLGYPRNYYAEVSPEEKANIRFIVTTLANKSLIAIAFEKGALEDAGTRIDHIHPLRFLLTIFTDEELKAGIRNIRGKGWVWNHFVGGLKDCLATETKIDNMKREIIENFSQIVSIQSSFIIPSIFSQNWDEFIDQLITHIPRKGDHDRYDT